MGWSARSGFVTREDFGIPFRFSVLQNDLVARGRVPRRSATRSADWFGLRLRAFVNCLLGVARVAQAAANMDLP